MHINWFSPGSKDLLDLLPSDIGRPIGHFALKFADADLLLDAGTVLDKLISIEAEVRSNVGRWYVRRMLPYRTQDDRIAGVVVTFVDITEHKQSADAINEARIYAETIVETIRQPLLVLDSELRIRSANRAFHKLFAVSATETENSLLYELGNRQWDIPPLRSLLDAVLRTEAKIDDFSVEQDFPVLGRRTMLLSAHKIQGDSGRENLILLAIEDVTARIHTEAQLKHDAAHDGLTGLPPNRREFERRLQRAVLSALQHGSEHVLCYFDLDQFKLINDTAGHAAGDALLQQVRGLLTGKSRDRDTLARLGGDEFALLLEKCTLSEASRSAEIIVATFGEWRFVWEGRSLQVGASAGVVAITARSESAAQVLSQADVACYTAKENGRNRVIVYGAEPSPHHAQIFVAATLKQALEQNRFRLFGQPIVSLAADRSAAPLHYEILIRLLDDEDHVMLPNTFIPAAERFGLMAAIDRWVIATAFRTYAERGRASAGVRIAINLSGGSLNTVGFAKFVLGQLKAYCVPSDRICFEITETAAIHNLDQTIEFIGEMKTLGGRFALDDFGSGLSSFRYLRVLPADYLKIDGSFVEHMADNPQDEAMVAAINEVGHTLGIATIAEHAHNGAVVDRLRHLGVDYAQGYAFAAPMPLDSLL